MTDHKHPFEQFEQRRQQGNERVLDTHSLATKRFFGLDKQVYADGALDARTKELLGLVASAVLRCNDCIDYHVQQCIEQGVGKEEQVTIGGCDHHCTHEVQGRPGNT